MRLGAKLPGTRCIEIFFWQVKALKKNFQHLEGLDYGISPDHATDFAGGGLGPDPNSWGLSGSTANFLRYRNKDNGGTSKGDIGPPL